MESKQVLFRGPHQFWKMSYENRMISLKTLIIQTSPKTTPNTFPEHRFETRNCQARKLHSLKFKKICGDRGPLGPLRGSTTDVAEYCLRSLFHTQDLDFN